MNWDVNKFGLKAHGLLYVAMAVVCTITSIFITHSKYIFEASRKIDQTSY